MDNMEDAYTREEVWAEIIDKIVDEYGLEVSR